MTLLKSAVLTICFSLSTVFVAAQDRIIAPSVNPAEDSIAVARIRARMDSLRRFRTLVGGGIGFVQQVWFTFRQRIQEQDGRVGLRGWSLLQRRAPWPQKRFCTDHREDPR